MSTTTEISIADPTDLGTLGVYRLKHLWSRTMAARAGRRIDSTDESHLDYLMIHALGLGLEQTMQYLLRVAPSFEEFEQWIVETTGGADPTQVARVNAAILGTSYPEETNRLLASIEESEPVLTDEDLAFWEEHGYVVLHDAITPEECTAAEEAILEHIGARSGDQESWYRPHSSGIMVQFFQHPALMPARRSRRIHKAFSQLWGTADLWVTTDRCGFNVPERPGWKFQGPDLHWDVSLQQPIPFGTLGILYLTDTPPEQGAFTLVPGFHHRVGEWLDSLPPNAVPQRQDLHALGSQPIGGRAGDLIIWHHALPHGSRPNRGVRPRIVQYLNMFPTRMEIHEVWR